MALLTLEDYPSVRRAIDITFDEKTIPNEVIRDFQFAGEAEFLVLDRDPNALTYVVGDAGYNRVKRAVRYFTAALLVPSTPNIIKETLGDFSYQRTPRDLALQAAELFNKGEAALHLPSEHPEEVPDSRIPFFFSVGGGRNRGY